MLCFSTLPNQKLRKRKIKNVLVKSIHNITDSNNPSNCRRILSKKIEKTLQFVDFVMAFDYKHIGKMEERLLAYDRLKKIFTAIMTFYKNTVLFV